MKHPKVAVILATGGSGMVRAAYSSGKPAYGVGPGNVPVLIDTSADIPQAVEKVVSGKSFDYGTVCSSEQSVVAERSLRDRLLAEFQARKAYLLNDAERAAVQKVLFSSGTTVSAACVGQSPQKIARMAGISVPADASILVAEIAGIGKEHPLSAEKLSPVLAVHFADGFEGAIAACEAILHFGGVGHTAVIFATDEGKVRQFGLRMPAFRVLVNTASPQGSVGITTGLQPSMTLGCGAIGGNVTSDNVGPQHLVNIKRIAWAIRTPDEAMSGAASAQAAPAAAATGLDRQSLVAAVERYLAQRGVTVTGSAPAPAPAAPRPAPLRATVESVVDRFLAGRAQEAPPAAPSCGCSLKKAPDAPAAAAAPEPAKKAEIPAPKVEIVDFVCEADVRAALAQNRKIFIGPKTIVTPSAREVAARDEVLVMAQR
jgi:hypothetical protein